MAVSAGATFSVAGLAMIVLAGDLLCTSNKNNHTVTIQHRRLVHPGPETYRWSDIEDAAIEQTTMRDQGREQPVTWAKKRRDQYRVGDSVTAYVDPASPSQGFLIRQLSWFPLAFVALPLLLGALFSFALQSGQRGLALAGAEHVPMLNSTITVEQTAPAVGASERRRRSCAQLTEPPEKPERFRLSSVSAVRRVGCCSARRCRRRSSFAPLDAPTPDHIPYRRPCSEVSVSFMVRFRTSRDTHVLFPSLLAPPAATINLTNLSITTMQ